MFYTFMIHIDKKMFHMEHFLCVWFTNTNLVDHIRVSWNKIKMNLRPVTWAE